MCTPINIPSAPIAIIYHQHLLHHHYFHSPQPPPPRPSVISTSAATPSSNTQTSKLLPPDHSMPSSFLQPPQSLLPPMQYSHHQLHPVLTSFTSLNHTQLFSHTYKFSACSIASLLLHTFSISQLPFINSQLILSFLFFTPRLTARLTRTEVSRCGSRGISAIASMEWHWVPMAGATPSAHCSRGTPA